MTASLIIPDWPAPKNIRAVSTTRRGGVSSPPWDSFNLGRHVGDLPSHVESNREKLAQLAQLPNEPFWLNQIHSTKVIEVQTVSDILPEADASFSQQAKQVCVVMTADCLPVLFCDANGRQVAAAHAGWRGLCEGIIENTLATFECPMRDIHAWLGPAIGPKAFEVGSEVRSAFIQQQAEAASCFTAYKDKYLADLAQLAALRLQRAGVRSVSYAQRCTVSEPDTFFSYRRDGETGRLASLIWIDS